MTVLLVGEKGDGVSCAFRYRLIRYISSVYGIAHGLMQPVAFDTGASAQPIARAFRRGGTTPSSDMMRPADCRLTVTLTASVCGAFGMNVFPTSSQSPRTTSSTVTAFCIARFRFA